MSADPATRPRRHPSLERLWQDEDTAAGVSAPCLDQDLPLVEGEGITPDERIAAVAARQHGAFTATQARAAGHTRHGIEHRRTTGRWADLRRGVYAIAGAPSTWEQHVMGCVLSLGPAAAGAGTTAARLHGLIERTGHLIHVVMPTGQHRMHRSGVTVHEGELAKTDIRTVNGIRVTAPNRTIVDLAALLPRQHLEAALDNAILLGLTTAVSLQRYIADRRLGHRPGMKALRELLDDRTQPAPQSELERLFLRKLRAAGLPEPARQHPVGRRRIDFAYPRHRVAIELKGRAFHASHKSFHDDPRRRNDLVLAGWQPLEFTWQEVDERWSVVEATIRRALPD